MLCEPLHTCSAQKIMQAHIHTHKWKQNFKMILDIKPEWKCFLFSHMNCLNLHPDPHFSESSCRTFVSKMRRQQKKTEEIRLNSRHRHWVLLGSCWGSVLGREPSRRLREQPRQGRARGRTQERFLWEDKNERLMLSLSQHGEGLDNHGEFVVKLITL